MPKFTLVAQAPVINKGKFDDALIKFLNKKLREGAKIFAQTALKQIPIHTGFVAGSFGTLQDLVGANAHLNPIVRFVRKTLASARKLVTGKPSAHGIIGNPELTEFYYPPGGGKVLKSPTSGRQFASAAEDIFKQEGNLISFNYSIDITYFAINDAFAGRSPTAPWRAFELAGIAFVNFLESVVPEEFPQMQDFIEYVEIKV